MNLELKIPPPIVALICAIVMWSLSRVFSGLDFDFANRKLLAVCLLFVGISIDLFALLKFKQKQTTINPMKPEQTSDLVISGIYKVSRNPMYLGLLIILSAWTVFLGNVISLIMLPVFIFYITKFQILPEEIIMLEKFPDSYIQYKKRVRRWI